MAKQIQNNRFPSGRVGDWLAGRMTPRTETRSIGTGYCRGPKIPHMGRIDYEMRIVPVFCVVPADWDEMIALCVTVMTRVWSFPVRKAMTLRVGGFVFGILSHRFALGTLRVALR